MLSVFEFITFTVTRLAAIIPPSRNIKFMNLKFYAITNYVGILFFLYIYTTNIQ